MGSSESLQHMAGAVAGATPEFVVDYWQRIGGAHGMSHSVLTDFLVFRYVYRGCGLTVIFCRCRQGLNWFHSGPAEGGFKKTKEFQRFPWDAKYGSLEVQAGISSPSRGRVTGNVVFHWFYKGSRLTVRFLGAQFFLASTKSLLYNGFTTILGAQFFGNLQSKLLET